MTALPVRTYGRWAALCLLVTLLSGTWLRAGMIEPGLLLGTPFRFGVHAHSHLAFFGWATMALFALLARDGVWGRRWHAHAVGAASLAAFAAFLTGGYGGTAIAVSSLHVLLWLGFVVGARGRLARVPQPARSFQRAALTFLVLAAAGTLAPAAVLVRGVSDPWLGDLAVKLFLVPFMGGWLTLGVMGAVYRRVPDARLATPALLAVAAGVLPSTLLFVGGDAPVAWAGFVGRAGIGLTGAGALLFGADVLRATPPRAAPAGGAFVRVAGAAAALKGALEVLAAAGVGGSLVRSPQVSLAYLHLVLLGVVTAGLLGCLRRESGRLDAALVAGAGVRPPRVRGGAAWAAAYAGGLGLMLTALVALGWGRAFGLAVAVGLGGEGLLWLALLGGAVVAVGGVVGAGGVVGFGAVVGGGGVVGGRGVVGAGGVVGSGGDTAPSDGGRGELREPHYVTGGRAGRDARLRRA